MSAPPSTTDPLLTRPDISTRVVAALLETLEDGLSTDAVDELIVEAGLDPGFVRDPEHWVGTRFLSRLRDAALTRMGVEGPTPGPDHPVWELWRRAGHASLDRRHLGPVWVIVRALGSPHQAYLGLALRAHLMNRTTRYEVLEACPRRFMMRLHLLVDPSELGPESCWTQVGVLEGTPRIWGLPMARVVHTRCLHRGDDACEFEVRFRDRSWRPALLALLAVGLGAALGTLVGLLSNAPLVGLVVGALGGVAAEGWRRALSADAAKRKDVADLERMVLAADRRTARLWAEGEELRRLILAQRNVQAFLPPAVFERLRSQQSRPRPGGARLDTTVLFSDIQGYSAISENLSPDRVVELLNAYYDEMATVIADHGGTVLEFMGDGLLVVFGAPDPDPDHATRAVACAIAMHGRVAQLNDPAQDGRLHPLLADTSADMLRIRVGLHSGEVLAGNLGAHDQMRYSVIGDVVNVAAHLERLNKQVHTHILLSGETRSRLPADTAGRLRSLGSRGVKGRDGEVELWTVEEGLDQR